MRDKKGRFVKGNQIGEKNRFKRSLTPWNKGLSHSEETRKKLGNALSKPLKQWSIYPKLRFDITNGQTLCIDCHKFKTFVLEKGKTADITLQGIAY